MMDSQDIYTYQAMRCVSEKEKQQIRDIFTSKKRGATTKIDNLSLSGCIGNKLNTNSGSLSPIFPFTSPDNYNLKLLQGGKTND